MINLTKRNREYIEPIPVPIPAHTTKAALTVVGFESFPLFRCNCQSAKAGNDITASTVLNCLRKYCIFGRISVVSQEVSWAGQVILSYPDAFAGSES